VHIDPEPISGEASERGRELVDRVRSLQLRPETPAPLAWVAGGETTVTVRGPGRGGRNQELALAAALRMEQLDTRQVLLAAGTDGIDGSSEHAGAVVDPRTSSRIRAAGLDPRAALERNDSSSALEAAGDTLTTGPTGTNVCDLVVVIPTSAA
jgi:hydroxypyruvate reductase